jgi:hypothetical protein
MSATTVIPSCLEDDACLTRPMTSHTYMYSDSAREAAGGDT